MKVKYMGLADVRLIEAGEDFNGRLATPVAETVRWDKDNKWVVDTDEVGLSADAVAFLVEDGQGFLDVTDLERVPVNQVQATWYGLTDVQEEVVEEAPVAEVTADPAPRGGRITPPEDQEARPA